MARPRSSRRISVILYLRTSMYRIRIANPEKKKKRIANPNSYRNVLLKKGHYCLITSHGNLRS